METILGWVSTYGYAAIYFLLLLGIVGLPIPDETLLVLSGYLISKGRFHPAATLTTAFLGSASGITVSYTIGRTLGLGIIHKYGRFFHITERHVARVHDWYERVGHWLLIAGYYMPGVRHFSAVVAGTSKLHFASFALFAYTGALLWVSTFLTLGYYLGENWERVFPVIQRYLGIASLVLIAAALAYYLVRRKQEKIH